MADDAPDSPADTPPSRLMRARTLSKLDQTVGMRVMPLTDKEMSKLSKVELRRYELAQLDALVERAKLMGQADLVDRASRKRQTAVHRLATTVEDEKRASALAAAAAEAAALVARAAAAAATVTDAMMKFKAPGADAKSRNKSRESRESRESRDGSSAAGARHGAAATDGKGAAEVLLATADTSDAVSAAPASNANAQPSTTTTSKPSNPAIIVPTALTPSPASALGVTAGAMTGASPTARTQTLSQSLAVAKKAMARMEAARTKALKFIELAKKRERVQDKARIQNALIQYSRGPTECPLEYLNAIVPLDCCTIE